MQYIVANLHTKSQNGEREYKINLKSHQLFIQNHYKYYWSYTSSLHTTSLYNHQHLCSNKQWQLSSSFFLSSCLLMHLSPSLITAMEASSLHNFTTSHAPKHNKWFVPSWPRPLHESLGWLPHSWGFISMTA